MKRLYVMPLLLSVAIVVLILLIESDNTEESGLSGMNILKISDTMHPGDDNRSMQSSLTFPTVQGSNLDGRDFVLPDDFEGKLNLVFIAFLQEQQAIVNTWLPFAQTLSKNHPGVRYYELPTIERLNPLFQWYINRGMRSGIPDSTARATTITLYLDKPTFRQALDIPDEDTIYVFLVNEAGQIVWRTEGVRTDEVASELQDVIKANTRLTNHTYTKTLTL